MRPKRLVLFSGMGGDSRLFDLIRVDKLELITPDHVAPQPDEDLPSYAKRVAAIFEIGSEDVIGGASFGGMIAAEIASNRQVAGLLLLGSCVQPGRLPWSYKWAESVSPLIPDWALGLRSWKPLVRWRFYPVDSSAEDRLIDMAASCPPSQIRAFGRMALKWEGAPTANCPSLSIHGDRDRIIPIACASPDIVLSNAGHAFTLTHAPDTNTAIGKFLGKL